MADPIPQQPKVAAKPTYDKRRLTTLRNTVLNEQEIQTLKQQQEVFNAKTLRDIAKHNEELNKVGLKHKEILKILQQQQSEKLKTLELEKKSEASLIIQSQSFAKQFGISQNLALTMFKLSVASEKIEQSFGQSSKYANTLSLLKQIPIFGDVISQTEHAIHQFNTFKKATSETARGIKQVYSKVSSASSTAIDTFKLLRASGVSTFSALVGAAKAFGVQLSALAANPFGAVILGVIITIMTAVMTSVYALRTAFKFNLGNIAAIWGAMMAKIKQAYAIFELNIANKLQKFGPYLEGLFNGIAVIVETVVGIIMDFVSTFFDVISLFAEFLPKGKEVTNIFKILGVVLKILTIPMKMFIISIAATNGAVMFTISIIIKLISLLIKVYKKFLEIIGVFYLFNKVKEIFNKIVDSLQPVTNAFSILKDIMSDIYDLITLIPGKFTEWMNNIPTLPEVFSSEDKLAQSRSSAISKVDQNILKANAGNMITTNSAQTNNVNIVVQGNADKETVQYMVEKQKSAYFDISKYNKLNPTMMGY